LGVVDLDRGGHVAAGDAQKPDIVASLWIDRPAQDIWDYLCDVSGENKWREGVKSAEWVSDPPYGVGSSGLHVIETMGDWPLRVTEWETPRQMSWVATGGRLEGIHAGYGLRPEGTGTRVTIHMRGKRSVPMGIFMFLTKRRIERQLAGDLQRLKAIMEA
jgi:uncharacterized membrane protein